MTTVGGELAAFLNSMCPEVRKAMLAEFDGHPELYNRNYYWSIQEYRRQVVKRLQRITSLKFASVRDYDR